MLKARFLPLDNLSTSLYMIRPSLFQSPMTESMEQAKYLPFILIATDIIAYSCRNISSSQKRLFLKDNFL